MRSHGQIRKVHDPVAVGLGVVFPEWGAFAPDEAMAADKTAAQQETLAKLQAMLEPVARSEGLVLVEMQYRPEGSGLVLRLFVDRPEGGVTLEECAQVSRQVSDLLDVEDMIPSRFHLEVSSPGLNRRLKTERDFELFAGRAVKVIYLDEQGKSRTVRGQLKGVQGQEVLLDMDGRMLAVPLARINKANLDPGL